MEVLGMQAAPDGSVLALWGVFAALAVVWLALDVFCARVLFADGRFRGRLAVKGPPQADGVELPGAGGPAEADKKPVLGLAPTFVELTAAEVGLGPLVAADGAPRASREHRNSPWWIAENVLSLIHAVVVSVLALVSIVAYSVAAYHEGISDAMLKAPDNLLWANSPGSGMAANVGSVTAGIGCMLTGAYMISDTIALALMPVMDGKMHGVSCPWDMIVAHHVPSLLGCALVRGLVPLPFAPEFGQFRVPFFSAIVLLAELTTVPLCWAYLSERREEDPAERKRRNKERWTAFHWGFQLARLPVFAASLVVLCLAIPQLGASVPYILIMGCLLCVLFGMSIFWSYNSATVGYMLWFREATMGRCCWPQGKFLAAVVSGLTALFCGLLALGLTIYLSPSP